MEVIFRALSIAGAALYAVPMLAVLWLAVSGESTSWTHLSETVLPLYMQNAALLLVGTSLLAALFGISTAWLTTLYEFPFRRTLQWLVLLPLAMPAYLSAMVYSEWFEPAGILGGTNLPFHSVGGACLLLALSFYPYVYMLARIAFRQQCVTLYEAAEMLGVPRSQWWWRIGVPGARPAIAVGVALVAMEALADFGTVSILGVQSFTTGIYRSWYGMGDLPAAAQLSAYLLIFVVGLLYMERRGRRHANYASLQRARGRIKRITLSVTAGWRVALWCALPVLLGFVLPLVQWLQWAGITTQGGWDEHTVRSLETTLLIAFGATLLTLAVAYGFAYRLRSSNSKTEHTAIRIAASGYAVPGSVIAVGVFIPLIALDKAIAPYLAELFGTQAQLWLSGGLFAVVLACSVRFLTLALAQQESALGGISQTMDDAATMLGANSWRVRREVHWHMLKPAMVMASILLIADVIKELPATILLRPFNRDTLAVRTYELATDGRLLEAAPTALLMIGITSMAIFCLVRFQSLQEEKPFTQQPPRAMVRA